MLRFHIYDVFTTTPFTGNPLAIVEGADDLSTAQMQTLARQFNLSETIFIQRPEDPAHTARVRIFFPTAEIPFAGHPTIGCALHLAGETETHVTLEEQAGLVPVTITRRGDGPALAEFTAPKTPHRHAPTPPQALIARALGIPPTDLGPTDPGVWQGGPAFLYVPVTDLSTLATARPCEPAWSELMAMADVDSAYLYTPTVTGYRARMFSPTAGIPEDAGHGIGQRHSRGPASGQWRPARGHDHDHPHPGRRDGPPLRHPPDRDRHGRIARADPHRGPCNAHRLRHDPAPLTRSFQPARPGLYGFPWFSISCAA
jgi:trans-2,3-dihydro-3-hydroxyanthranilate isomerase